MLRRSVLAILLLVGFAAAQVQPGSPQIQPGSSAITPKITEFVSLNFGTAFQLIDRYPILTGDLDGDGTEDAVFVLTRKDNPLLDEAQFHYKVIDPYDEYFGFGDPRVTTSFNAHDPDQVKYIAIVHNWKAATPKAKYLVINLPFEKLTITRIPLKKKKIATALAAEELGGLTSAIYWDGKKYKWDAMSAPD
jgi:hypothetical protein